MSATDAARCATCAHWTPQDYDGQFDRIGFRECVAVRQREAVEREAPTKGLMSAARREAEDAAIIAARAVVIDGSSCMAALITGPDFGCILHEAAK